MDSNNVEVQTRDSIARVSISRPKVLNALNADTISELEQRLLELKADPAVRGVVLTGAGDKAFVAGADIKELATQTAATGLETARRGQSVFRQIETLGKPVVAAVNGYALGGGLELALACHLRFAARGAKMGLPEVKLGVIPGYGGTQRLARLVGRGRALEMILSGEPIDADEAFRIGLVNRVVEQEELVDAAEAFLTKTLANGPMALSMALAAVDQGLDLELEKGLLLEATLFSILCATDDMKEGMAAFLEKRQPDFRGS